MSKSIRVIMMTALVMLGTVKSAMAVDCGTFSEWRSNNSMLCPAIGPVFDFIGGDYCVVSNAKVRATETAKDGTGLYVVIYLESADFVVVNNSRAGSSQSKTCGVITIRESDTEALKQLVKSAELALIMDYRLKAVLKEGVSTIFGSSSSSTIQLNAGVNLSKPAGAP